MRAVACSALVSSVLSFIRNKIIRVVRSSPALLIRIPSSKPELDRVVDEDSVSGTRSEFYRSTCRSNICRLTTAP